MRHAGLDEVQAGIKIARRNNLRCADDNMLMAESEEELKSLLRKVKEESEKVDFVLGGSKITTDADCSHEIKRHLLLGRKLMTNIYSILKSRDITLPRMVHLVKAMGFPVIIYGYKSWTIKKVECQRIDGFEMWCWKRLLKVPWNARRSNKSILMEISP